MRLPYSEGSVFMVPLRDSGYARGVVARMRPRGTVLFGYFFGPRILSNEEVSLSDLIQSEACYCGKFGDLGIIKGTWNLIGSIPNWNRSDWPMPAFFRKSILIGIPDFVSRYSENNPSELISHVPGEFEPGMAEDCSCGFGAIEIILTNLLKTRSLPSH